MCFVFKFQGHIGTTKGAKWDLADEVDAPRLWISIETGPHLLAGKTTENSRYYEVFKGGHSAPIGTPE